MRFYGQCKLNGKTYILDPDAPVSVIDGQEMFSPDLITYEQPYEPPTAAGRSASEGDGSVPGADGDDLWVQSKHT